MSKISYSALVNTIRGTLSGSVLSNCRGTNYLKRHSPAIHQPRSSGQQEIRGILNNLSGMWYGLDPVKKNLWEELASLHRNPMSGLDCFNSHNLPLWKYLGKSYIIDAPPSFPDTPGFPRGIAINATSGGDFVVTWEHPSLSTVYMITKYWSMPGRYDNTIHRFKLGSVTSSDSLTTTVSTSLPNGFTAFFKLRTLDLLGRLSPWTHLISDTVEEAGGLNWVNLGSMYAQTAIYTVANGGSGIAFAGTGSGARVLRSSDYGANWSNQYGCSGESRVYSIASLGNNVVICGTGIHGKIYRSTDNGLSFSDLGQQASEERIYSMCNVGSGIAIAGTYQHGHILRTIDYGANWSDIGRPQLQQAIHSLCYLASNIVLAGTGTGGIILRSTDGGLTWPSLGNMFGETQIYSLCYLGNGIALAGTNPHGKILRSVDYGANWTDLGQQAGEASIRSIIHLGGGICCASTANNGHILRSTNYGLTWTDLGQMFSVAYIHSLSFLGNSICIAGTESNAYILRSAP